MEKKNKNNYGQIVKALAWVTQLSLNMVTPLILCVILASFLQKKLTLGNGIMIFAILLGIGAGFTSLIKFIKVIKKENEQ